MLDGNGRRRDLSQRFTDWDRDFFGTGGLQKLERLLQQGTVNLPFVPEGVRWASPFARPGKVVCIGLNYSAHAKESRMPIPEEPIDFLKAARMALVVRWHSIASVMNVSQESVIVRTP